MTRNKYIGDNSRASDTLFNNKEMIINPIQFSLDLNTLSTAKIVNISSMLAPNKSSRILFLAPYMNKDGKYIRSNFIDNQEQDEEKKLLAYQRSTNEPSSYVPTKTKERNEDAINTENILTFKRVIKPTKGGGFSPNYGLTDTQDKTDNEELTDYEGDTEEQFVPQVPQMNTGQQMDTGEQTDNEEDTEVQTVTGEQMDTEEKIDTGEQLDNNNLGQGIENIDNNPSIYLQNMYKSMKYINDYKNNNNEINSFVARYYLDYINKNMKLYSQSLSLDSFINLINQKDKSLFIQKTYSTF